MKKWQVKLINVDQRTDLEAELNKEGQEGWRFSQAIGTPFGVKFLLERQLDEEVNADAVLKAREAELTKKFGL